jgi:hypothetical protein
MIAILYHPDDITLLYSFYPLLISRYRSEFAFLRDTESIRRASYNALIVFRGQKIARTRSITVGHLLGQLRDLVPRLLYFDDHDSADEVVPDAFPFVDAYLKKQIARELKDYGNPIYGKRTYAQYFHRNHGISDDNEVIQPPLDDAAISKIVLSWNLGLGPYPRAHWRSLLARRMDKALGAWPIRWILPRNLSIKATGQARLPKASARFSTRFDRSTIEAHRRAFLNRARSSNLFLTEKVPLREYNRELRKVAATISPFGWGEVCFRDFEAVFNRSVLVKPSLDRVETWPDIYRAGETYVSVSWNAEDLVQKVSEVIEDSTKCRRITDNAVSVLIDAHSCIDDVIERFISLAHGGNASKHALHSV